MLGLHNFDKLMSSVKDFPNNCDVQSNAIEFTYPQILHTLFKGKLNTEQFTHMSHGELAFDRGVSSYSATFYNHKKLSFYLVNVLNITRKKDFDKIDYDDFTSKRLQLYILARADFYAVFNNFNKSTLLENYFYSENYFGTLIDFLRHEIMYELDSFVKVERFIFFQLKPSAAEYCRVNDPKFVILNYVEGVYHSDLYKFYNLVSTMCSFVVPSLVNFNKLFFRIKTNVWYFDLEPTFKLFKKISINVVIFMIFFS